MTDTDLDGWTDDGHTATITLDVTSYHGATAHIHCPFEHLAFTDITIGSDEWGAMPGCRRELDEYRTPIGPSKECLIKQWERELGLDELFEQDGKNYVVVSPFRIAWRWLVVENGPELRPIDLAVFEEPSR